MHAHVHTIIVVVLPATTITADTTQRTTTHHVPTMTSTTTAMPMYAFWLAVGECLDIFVLFLHVSTCHAFCVLGAVAAGWGFRKVPTSMQHAPCGAGWHRAMHVRRRSLQRAVRKGRRSARGSRLRAGGSVTLRIAERSALRSSALIGSRVVPRQSGGALRPAANGGCV